MSMLAERRQKQKQSLNPRGKWWAEDSNKIGQKMLEKMGWTKGKGLGANEQGITEYTKVTFKDDTTGVGYDKNVETWTEHNEKFNNFLQQFQRNQYQDIVKKSENGDNNLNGSELKSKQSHARIHYQKFIRGKDTSKYKAKDLANILGQKELTDETTIKINKDENIYENETIGTRDNKHGVVTINGGSMVDYFKFKLNYDNTTNYIKNKPDSNRNLSNDMTNNQTIVSESEDEQRVSFASLPKVENTLSHYELSKDSGENSNYAFDNPCLGMNSPTEANINGSSKKSTKKRKKFENDNLHITEIDKHNTKKKLKTEIIDSSKDGFINPALNLDIKSEEDCNGKEFEVSRAQFGLENCGLDLTDERSDKKHVTFNDRIMLYEYDKDSIKKRKGKATLDKFEVENKKQKKKRKLESITTLVPNGIINEALDVEMLCDEVNDNQLNEHISRKIKKRKICKMTSLETIQESPERENEIIEINTESEDISIVENGETDTMDKKSKKKKKTRKIESLDVIDEELDVEIEEIISDKNITRDKKSKGDIISFKKCKKEKKDKKKSESKKYIVEIEISSDEQNTKILDKPNSKQQQNNLIENEDKDKVKIETLSAIEIEEEKEQETVGKTKQKKKKRRNSINKQDSSNNEVDACDIEKEVSDKENAEKEQNLDTKKLAKKSKKHKKSKDKDTSDAGDSSNPNIEAVDTNTIKQEQLENTEFTDTPSKKNKVVDVIDSICSPWNAKQRMSKKMLISFFHNSAILDFPGSNVHDIKGYGTDI